MDKHLNKILEEITIHKNGLALATIIDIEGSAYRKKGTMMLFTKDEKQIGMLTVGCLEDDAQEQVKRMVQDGKDSCLMTYDMSSEDDLGWGRGVGCQGKIHVLFEKVTDQLIDNLDSVRAFLERGVMVRAYKHLAQVPDFIETAYHTDIDIVNDEPDHKDVYVHLFVPQKRMILFGAGEDVIPLANLAVKTGFEVFVWDFRRSLLTEKRLPNVHFLEAWRNFQFRPTDSIIIMTHDFRKDQAILHALLERERVSYLGVMGPQRRTKRLLKAAVIPEFLHSPVGMDIGAEGPDEIAVSIMAEVIKVQRRAMIEDNCNISGSREKQAFRDKG